MVLPEGTHQIVAHAAVEPQLAKAMSSAEAKVPEDLKEIVSRHILIEIGGSVWTGWTDSSTGMAEILRCNIYRRASRQSIVLDADDDNEIFVRCRFHAIVGEPQSVGESALEFFRSWIRSCIASKNLPMTYPARFSG